MLADVRIVEDLSGRLDEGDVRSPCSIPRSSRRGRWASRRCCSSSPTSTPPRTAFRDHVRVVRRGRFLLGDDLAIRPGFTVEDVRAALKQPN